MVHKEYNSPDYYAQTLVEFLTSDEPKHEKEVRIGARYRASSSKGKVFSSLVGIDWSINFEVNGSGNVHYTLEVSVGNRVLVNEAGRIKIERSPTGRISGNHWRNFYQKVILPGVRNAAKANQQ